MQQYLGGEDRIEAILGIHWGDCHQAWMTLDRAKKEAQAADKPVPVQFRGWEFIVEPRGRGAYSWAIWYKGVLLLLSQAMEPSERYGNARLEIGSLACGEFGVRRCMAQVRRIILGLGGKLTWNKVMRVDPCLDLPDKGGAELIAAFMQGARACQATHYAAYFRARAVGGVADSVHGLMIGKGDITCRIYDKLAELAAHPNGADAKFRFLVSSRWGGVAPSSAWRVEFQVRRAPLRDFKDEHGRAIDSVEDYLELRAGLLKYLTTKWLRVTSDKPSRGNSARVPEHDVWRRVREGFAGWCGGVGEGINRQYRRVSDAVATGSLCAAARAKRLKAACSLVLGAVLEARMGEVDPWEVKDLLAAAVTSQAEGDAFYQTWNRQLTRLAKRVPAGSRLLRQLSGKVTEQPAGVEPSFWDAVEYLEDTFEFCPA